MLRGQNMDTEGDPLAITPTDNLSLFGGSMENIEFILESDDEDDAAGIKSDGMVIEIDDLDEKDIHQIMNSKEVVNISFSSLQENQIIDLDQLTTNSEEVKEEIDIGEEGIPLPYNYDPNNDLSEQKEIIICEKLENFNPDGPQHIQRQIRCYVPNCSSDYRKYKDNEDMYWFCVPVNENLKKIWDICINRVDKRLSNEDLVCHKHFSEEDIVYKITVPNTTGEYIPYSKPKLRQGAVPCITFHKECCVPNCRRNTGRMYCFPVIRTSDFHLWLYMIKNGTLKNLTKREVLKYRICSIHFESDCFNDDFSLMMSAAPTLHIPDTYTVDVAHVKSVPLEKTVSNAQTNIILICAHGECMNRSNTGKHLFRFPTVPDRCIAWLEACGRKSLISTPLETVKKMSHLRLGVCEDHFDFRHFEASIDRLKSNAIPKQYSELGIDFRKSKSFSRQENKFVAGSSNAPKTLMKAVKTNARPIASNSVNKSFTGTCSYKGCQGKISADNPFFSIPTHRERCKIWLKACGLLDSSSLQGNLVIQNLRICRKHFENYMFETQNKLKHDAIPISYTNIEALDQVNEETTATDHYSTSVKSNRNIKKQQNTESKHNIYCAVKNCPNIYNVKYWKKNNHKFPNPNDDPQRFNIWLELVANPKLSKLSQQEIYTKYMVCIRHFERYFYQNGKPGELNQEAVPTKRLTADNQWFFTSDYYNTRLLNYLIKAGIQDSDEDVSIEWKEEDNTDMYEVDDKTKCVLEKNGLRFPGMGRYLRMGKSKDYDANQTTGGNINKRKLPYGVYNYFTTGYGLNNDVEIGESIKIHTAIIIDDDDNCERQVLQQLLDKRRKNS